MVFGCSERSGTVQRTFHNALIDSIFAARDDGGVPSSPPPPLPLLPCTGRPVPSCVRVSTNFIESNVVLRERIAFHIVIRGSDDE